VTDFGLLVIVLGIVAVVTIVADMIVRVWERKDGHRD